MLAAALRSLLVVECEGGDGLPPRGQGLSSALLDVPLDGIATSLDWDVLSNRIAITVTGGAGGTDRVSLLPVVTNGGNKRSALEEEVLLPVGAGAADVSVRCKLEDGATWVAVACSDGALRLIDASPGNKATIARTLYNHGVAATAVRLSHNLQRIASGSANGHVLMQSFSSSAGPTSLPGISDGPEMPVTGLQFSSLRSDTLAACDMGGNLQVWDTGVFRHTCKFPHAHSSAARGLSFSMHNSDLLISGGDDARLVFWDVNNGRQIREVGVESGLASLSYHTGGYLLAAGTCDGSVLLFDLRMLVSKAQPALPVNRFSLHQARAGGRIRAMAFAPPGCSQHTLADPVPPTAETTARESASHENTARETMARANHPVLDRAVVHEAFDDVGATVDDSVHINGSAPADTATGHGPTTATLQSMMNKLNTRYYSDNSSNSGLPLRSSSSTRNNRGASISHGLKTDHVEIHGVGLDDKRSEKDTYDTLSYKVPPLPRSSAASSALPSGAAPASCSTSPAGLAPPMGLVPPLPTVATGPMPMTPSMVERQRPLSVLPPETPFNSQRGAQTAAWFSIASTPPEQGLHMTNSPWWNSNLTAAEDRSGNGVAATSAADMGPSVTAIVEALKPWFANLRKELIHEVRETQCALLEQNFRLHAESKRDIEELRAEIEQLRGELRVL